MPIIDNIYMKHDEKKLNAIHANIKNTRQDLMHKFTTRLVQGNALIVVGAVKTTQFVH